MDWMYKNPTSIDPEEYLLGRTIDKSHFKETSPVNYMRSIKNEPSSSHSQVDLSRKILEDPLTTIKKKEIERRKLLYQKLQLKHGKAVVAVSASSTNMEEIQSKSLEQLIIENLKKLPFNIDLEKLYDTLKEKKKLKKQNKNEKEFSRKQSSYKSLEEESHSNYETSRSRRRIKHTNDDDERRRNHKSTLRVEKKYNLKHQKIKDISSDGSNSEHEDVKSHKYRQSFSGNILKNKKSKFKIDGTDQKRKKSLNDGGSDSDYENLNHKKLQKSCNASDLSSGRLKMHYREKYNSVWEKKNDKYDLNKYYARCSRERDYKIEKSEKNCFRAENKFHREIRKNYECPDNISVKNREKHEISRLEIRRHHSFDKKKPEEYSSKHSKYHGNSRECSKEKFNSHKKLTLTEEEKEAKRREMMKNAVERDSERKKNIKRYEFEDKKEIEKSGKYNPDFAREQLSVLMASENSVEKRIRSNVPNIQRSSHDMDRNFVRRY